jgi:hypothetical protein
MAYIKKTQRNRHTMYSKQHAYSLQAKDSPKECEVISQNNLKIDHQNIRGIINKKTNDSKTLNIFHQNIRGLRGKVDELLSHLHLANPHILCFTEHHMNLLELQQLNTDSYKLGANYCRTLKGKGGVCIYSHTNLKIVNTDLNKYCKEKDLEIYAVKLNLSANKLSIIAIYRAPTGYFDTFITKLDTILGKLYTPEQEYIICGDININYFLDNEMKYKLYALLELII